MLRRLSDCISPVHSLPHSSRWLFSYLQFFQISSPPSSSSFSADVLVSLTEKIEAIRRELPQTPTNTSTHLLHLWSFILPPLLVLWMNSLCACHNPTPPPCSVQPLSPTQIHSPSNLLLFLLRHQLPSMTSFQPVSYTHLTLPTTGSLCRSRWSPYH